MIGLFDKMQLRQAASGRLEGRLGDYPALHLILRKNGSELSSLDLMSAVAVEAKELLNK